jgi:hypothetical protein
MTNLHNAVNNNRPSAPVDSTLASIQSCFNEVRQQTIRLTDGLSEEDCALQSMPDASPTKWHLGHTQAHGYPLKPNGKLLHKACLPTKTLAVILLRAGSITPWPYKSTTPN